MNRCLILRWSLRVGVDSASSVSVWQYQTPGITWGLGLLALVCEGVGAD